MTPTVELIQRRLRCKVDSKPGARARARRPDGHKSFTSGRRTWAVANALTWRALGYDAVEVSMTAGAGWRPFPASVDEARTAVAELAALPTPLSTRWRRLHRRIDRERQALYPD